MRCENYFFNLLKATRIERTLHIVATMLIPVAFANNINLDLIILGISCIFLYSGFSIHNALRDNDYELNKFAKIFSSLLILSAIIISLYNVIILASVFLWIVLGCFYNTESRKHLFLDVSVLDITHMILPIFSAGLLLGIPLKLNLILVGAGAIFFWFVANIKNLIGIDEDKRRKYKTIGTSFSNPIFLVKIFMDLAFIFLVLVFLLFDFNKSFLLVFLIILLSKLVIFLFLDSGESSLALKITRFNFILFALAFLVGKSSDFIFLGIGFVFASFLFWFPDSVVLIHKKIGEGL